MEKRDSEAGAGEQAPRSTEKRKPPRETGGRLEEELVRLLRATWASARAAESRAAGARETPGPADGDRRMSRGKEDAMAGGSARDARLQKKKPVGTTAGPDEVDEPAAAWAGASSKTARKGAFSKTALVGVQGGKGSWRSLLSGDGLTALRSPAQRAAQGSRGVDGGRSKTTRGAARLVIVDLRGKAGEAGGSGEGKVGAADRGARPGEETRKGVPERDLLAFLKTQGAADRSPGADGQGGESQRAPSVLRSFQERLIPEVVRHAGIVLKEGGNGEIRLLLKPESLGSVRIRLALSESSLEGRIVVENNTVRDLMEASLEQLKQALRAGGFQTATLEVAVGSRQNGHPSEGPLPVIEGVGSRRLETAVPPLVELITAEPSLVNLIV